MNTIDAMPQEIPNMVSTLRSLCAQILRRVCIRISPAKLTSQGISNLKFQISDLRKLRQHQLVAFFHTLQHLSPLSVGDTDFNRDLAPAGFGGRIEELNGNLFV